MDSRIVWMFGQLYIEQMLIKGIGVWIENSYAN